MKVLLSCDKLWLFHLSLTILFATKSAKWLVLQDMSGTGKKISSLIKPGQVPFASYKGYHGLLQWYFYTTSSFKIKSLHVKYSPYTASSTETASFFSCKAFECAVLQSQNRTCSWYTKSNLHFQFHFHNWFLLWSEDFFFGLLSQLILLCWPKLAKPDKAYMHITFSPKHLRVYENHHCSTWKCEVNVHQKNISEISNLGPGWDTTSEVVFQPTILWSWCQTAVKTCLKEKGKCQNHPFLTTTTTTKLSKSYSLSLESIQSNISNVAAC